MQISYSPVVAGLITNFILGPKAGEAIIFLMHVPTLKRLNAAKKPWDSQHGVRRDGERAQEKHLVRRISTFPWRGGRMLLLMLVKYVIQQATPTTTSACEMADRCMFSSR